MPTRGARRKAAKQRVAKIPKGNENENQLPVGAELDRSRKLDGPRRPGKPA